MRDSKGTGVGGRSAGSRLVRLLVRGSWEVERPLLMVGEGVQGTSLLPALVKEGKTRCLPSTGGRKETWKAW